MSDFNKYLVRLATDVDTLLAFMNDPRGAMNASGLSSFAQDLLLSGDQSRIYASIKGLPLPEPAGAAPPMQLPTVVATLLGQNTSISEPVQTPVTQAVMAPMAGVAPTSYGSAWPYVWYPSAWCLVRWPM